MRDKLDAVHATSCSGSGGGERGRLHRRRQRRTPAACSCQLKPLDERKVSADAGDHPAARARLARMPGATLFLQAVQDIRVGGRGSNAQYQYTLRGDNLDELNDVVAAAAAASCARCPSIRDVNSDQQNKGLQTHARSSTATPRRASASRRRRSTTRSTTRSASGRSRRCTRR